MSLATRVLVGLVAGLGVGIAISLWSPAAAHDVAATLAPIGTLWVNALRMTVIPLVVSSLVVGVAAAPDARSIGRVGWRGLLLFVAVLLAGAAFAVLVGQPLLARLSMDAATADALRASVAGGPPAAAAARL